MKINARSIINVINCALYINYSDILLYTYSTKIAMYTGDTFPCYHNKPNKNHSVTAINLNNMTELI